VCVVWKGYSMAFCGGWGGLMINAGRSKDAPDGDWAGRAGVGDATIHALLSI
jgi:hypothetical protein